MNFSRVFKEALRPFPPLQSVVSGLVAVLEVLEKSEDAELEEILGGLHSIIEVVHYYTLGDMDKRFAGSVERLLRCIGDQLKYLKGHRTPSKLKQPGAAEEAVKEQELCYSRAQKGLRLFLLDMNLLVYQTQYRSMVDARLDRLCPSFSAFYKSEQALGLGRGACAQDTCIEVLERLFSWAANPSSGPIYWLNGMAGTGKTTIAYSLCSILDTRQEISANFFCSRMLPECRDINRIIPTITYQMARYSQTFRSVIIRLLAEDPEAHRRPLEQQFESLIARPLLEIRDAIPMDFVVVIDGLDECDDKRGVSQILRILLKRSRDLPIKFVISSRPEPEVRSLVKGSIDRQEILQLQLHELDINVVQGDIKTYLREALGPVRPSEPDLAGLVQRAGASFSHAAAVVRYVGHQNFSKNPRRRLANILDTSGTVWSNISKELDEQYAMILEAAFDDPDLDHQDKEDTKRVLHTILSAQEPLTVDILSERAGLHDIARVYTALQPLWSVICISESNGFVSTIHVSFRDFVSDPIRSKKYHLDLTPTQDYVLAQRCFDCIRNTLPQFNICCLDSSWTPDNMVEGLAERIAKAITPELSYACRRWAAHLIRIREPDQVFEQLKDFLSVRLLLWMEVLNLQNNLDSGVEALRMVEDWCVRQSCSEELIDLAHDAWRFATTFVASPASQCTPHIYVSMLPFWPKLSPIAQHYAGHMKGRMVPPDAAILKRQSALLAAWDVGGPATSVAWSSDGTQIAFVVEGEIYVRESVTGKLVCGPLAQPSHSIQSIAFSPNGIRIASASLDGSIWWWDTHSGEASSTLRRQPGLIYSIIYSSGGARIVSSLDDKTIRICHALTGKLILLHHPNSVRVAAHSSDSTRIVSGTEDGTIYLWNAQSGATLGSFKGHVASITSLSVSANGARIISTCEDRTIGVWDENGRPIVPGPVEGHGARVTSTALSPDGARIVSGGEDNTLRLWDADSGRLLLGPLAEHTNSVTSVSFSPDGTRMLSCSQDGTIRVWDARTRQAPKSLAEKKGSVTSVVFYPGSAGVRVVSGSSDRAVRVWDVESGKLALGPLIRQTGSVKSVAISPDGALIVSGSDDATVCVWNAQNGQATLGPLGGHTDSVTSVAFSLDGALAISGSLDKTIRIWDSNSGRCMLEPLIGHDGSVTAITLSPDGSHILSGSTDKTLRMWSLQSGKPVLRPFEGHGGGVTAVAFSPNGARIASSSDKAICIWGPRIGKETLAELNGHDGWVTSVVFSSDGDCIISGSWDMTICVWDVESKQKLLGPLLGHKGPVTSVAISLDGTRIVSGSSDTTICVWDAQNGAIVLSPLEGHTSIVTSVALSADGGFIISGSGDRTVRVWDGRSGRMTVGPLTGHEDWVTSVALSPDGSQVVSGSSDNTIRIWDPVGGQMLFGPLTGHNECVLSVAFSPDGRYVVSGSGDQSIRVWDARSGQPTIGPLKGHRGWVTSVSVSPDGNYIASGSSDKTIYLWSMHGGGVLLHFQGHTSWVSSVAFSPDGAHVISGAWEKTIRLWDVQNPREPLSVIKGHTNSVTSLSFSPDSTCIVSGSNDKTIRMWDLQSGQMVLGPLEGHAGMVTCVAFSRDGTHVVSGCTEGIIRLWNTGSRSNQTRALPSSSDPADRSSLTINKDGWIVDRNDESRLLAWAPPDIRHALLLPRDTLLASGNEFARLNFSEAFVGEAWTGCYQVPDGL